MTEIKKFSDCKGSITQFLKPGDIVDDDFYDYFLGVLPPETNTSTQLQIGEPVSHNAAGDPTYMTLERDSRLHPKLWYYAGVKPSGESPGLWCCGEEMAQGVPGESAVCVHCNHVFVLCDENRAKHRYRRAQFEQIAIGHDADYKFKIEIRGTTHKSNYIDLSMEEFEAIKGILCGDAVKKKPEYNI